MTDSTKQFKRQFPRNSLSQVLAFVVQVGIGIWLVPYLIRNLGTAAYGLIPIAGAMTAYASLISQSISSAVHRFLTIALQQDDAKEANSIFSTAFYSYLGLGLLQIPIFILVINYAGSIINIPAGLYNDALILLACSAASFIVNLVASVFGVPMYARNRLDISRNIDIGRYGFRVLGIVVFFLSFGPALRYVGYVDLFVSLIICVIQVVIANRLTPELKLRLHYYDWHKIRPLLGMGGWLMVNQIGTLLFLQIDIWVCNRFVGPEAAGEYAAVLQWSTLIRQGGATISTVIAPMILIYFAKFEMEQLIRLSKISVRVLSLLLAVPVGVMCIYSSSLLHLWLGPAFISLAPLMVIMLCHLVINIGVMPLFNIQVAMNKVRLPAIVTLIMGVLNLVLAVAFVRYLNWGIYGVAVAGATVLTVKNALFTPVYAARLLNEPWHTFVKPYISSLVLLISLMATGYSLSKYAVPASFYELILFSLGIGTTGFAAVWLILPRSDRQVIRSLMPGRFGTMATKGFH